MPNEIEILEKYIKVNYDNQEGFAGSLGMTRQNLNYHVRKAKENNNEFSLDFKLKLELKGLAIFQSVKDKIVAPDPSTVVRADSKTLRKTHETAELIPFYDIDFVAGHSIEFIDDSNIEPEYYMDIPQFRGCKAFRSYSDSMNPTIKSGMVLFGNRLEEWHIHLEYGQIYGIVMSDKRRYLKYIKKHSENHKEYFSLVSENKDYDEFEIPKKKIKSIWLIEGWLNKNT